MLVVPKAKVHTSAAAAVEAVEVASVLQCCRRELTMTADTSHSRHWEPAEACLSIYILGSLKNTEEVFFCAFTFQQTTLKLRQGSW